ncbi:hypothetical protein E5336_04920 [Dubosiella muris]|uniref:Uncharacterized protein n=2 Tax=Dubosiella muris TaxID=3038133 RepID=A0AC61R7Q9_9FIRM|nr:hypothetical protein E5336_04920 [Dubosiella muris]
MVKIGEEKVRMIVKILPLQIIIQDIYTESYYACPACMNDGEGVLYKMKAAGALFTDDYAGYNPVDHDRRELGWAHARRYFVDALRDRRRNRRFHHVPAAGANGEDLPYRSQVSKIKSEKERITWERKLKIDTIKLN